MKRLYLIGEVNEDMYQRFSQDLAEVEASKIKSVEVEICSGGGDGDIGLALYGRMMSSPIKFTGIGHGVVHSAAMGPFIACDVRMCTPECTFLIHNSVDKVKGDYISVKRKHDHLSKEEEKWANIFRARAYKDYQTWRELSDEETYLDSTNALTYKLVHKILEYKK